jgi:5-formyltetrahydrofolate cyclo-ligase
MHDVSYEKKKLREELLKRRSTIPQSAQAMASSCVARHYADHPILAFASSIAGYSAMRSEIDVLPVFDIMSRYGKLTSLPCMTPQKSLIFRRWSHGDALVRHPTLHVQEPPATQPSVIPAIILTPLVAFDAMGYRLGYGAGYYDRTMQAMRRFDQPPLFIGVAYSAQEVERVPVDSNDQLLDGILTEVGVSMFR